jgi:hypothetical protein
MEAQHTLEPIPMQENDFHNPPKAQSHTTKGVEKLKRWILIKDARPLTPNPDRCGGPRTVSASMCMGPDALSEWECLCSMQWICFDPWRLLPCGRAPRAYFLIMYVYHNNNSNLGCNTNSHWATINLIDSWLAKDPHCCRLVVIKPIMSRNFGKSNYFY